MGNPHIKCNVYIGYTPGQRNYEVRDVELLAVNFNTRTVKVRYLADVNGTGKEEIRTDVFSFKALQEPLTFTIGE